MIDIQNGLYVSDEFQLLIDIQISGGEFCAVLGPSGAGKTTLLSVIAGFEDLQQGSLKLDGVDMAKFPPSRRPVSMVFQDDNSFSHLDVWTNVALGLVPSLKLDVDQMAIVDGALKQVGIWHLARKKPSEISGGERQRIALARVLVRDKPILLLDEAFAALDPGLRKTMLDLVLQLQRFRNLTVLMVTHQPEDANYACSKVIFVGDGIVHSAVPTKEFFVSTEKSVTAYLGSPSTATTTAAAATRKSATT